MFIGWHSEAKTAQRCVRGSSGRNLPGARGFDARTDARRARAVGDTGMRAWLEHEEPVATSERSQRLRQRLIWIAAASLGAGLVLSGAGFAKTGPAAFVCFVAALAAGVAVTARKAWSALRVGAL